MHIDVESNSNKYIEELDGNCVKIDFISINFHLKQMHLFQTFPFIFKLTT